MLREVVGAIMAATVGIIILWFILPMFTIAKSAVVATVNATDPMIAPLLETGDMVYAALPWVVVIVVGFLILAYATRQNPYDQ